MKNILNKINNLLSLTKEESYFFFKQLIDGKVSNCILKKALYKMHIKGEKKTEMSGAIKAFLKQKKYFPKPKYLYADIVGTGGDRKNTINISTISAIVSSSCGLKIVKHCNNSITGTIGSADLLNYLKIPINISSNTSKYLLDKYNLCFLLANKFYPSFKYFKKVRQELKIPTLFNLIAPLLNPSFPPLALIGIYNKKFLLPIIEVCKELHYTRVILVNNNNTDEVTLDGTTTVVELNNGIINSYELTKKDFGIKDILIKTNFSLKKNKKNNLKIAKKILMGISNEKYEYTIAMNVALTLKLFGNEDLIKNTKYAMKIIKSGLPYLKIKTISSIREK
ncbi:Anthranilate phosphoribosyltransferase [Buchnera aphidicola (Tetraneura ulmi)]|uniref:anthranilate phosphoribosyltransferase n=1 Tax=Buchnera aphidicola TaxID=9 RepID=UPI00346475BF